ncbi:MAG: histone deacetylase [Desulfovibrionaceae bacterium]|jgi:acetoin utilization deacetylase AcuC-like enzyme
MVRKLKIVNHPEGDRPFSEYGIGVSKAGSRASRVIRALLARKEFAKSRRQWLYDGPWPQVGREDLLRAHDAAFVDEFLSDAPERILVQAYELEDEAGNPRRFDPDKAERPLRDLVPRAMAQTEGTLQACRLALAAGFAYYLGGGMHHAGRAQCWGFCPVNDVVVAARRLQAEGAVRRVWIVDTDAHRSDGSAEILLGDPTILNLSIHMAAGWPLDGPLFDADGRLARCRYPTTVDIPIQEGGEEMYCEALSRGLALLETLSLQPPDLAVVVAGGDPWEQDGLESSKLLRLTQEQMLARDLLVYDFLSDRGIPQAWLMAGGYGAESWKIPYQFLTALA